MAPLEAKRSAPRMKGHTKSRRGCCSCKSRKVKCTEERPTCSSCEKRGVKCVYPGLLVPVTYENRKNHVRAVVANRQDSIVRSPDTPIRLTDLRLLHHFFLYAKPHMPPGNADAWLTEVPARAWESPMVMHAMLALAATHLSSQDVSLPSSLGLHHRQKAIRGMRQLLSRANTHNNTIELESILAASYALAQQSMYMEQGLQDIISLYRGCQTIYSTHLMQQRLHSSDAIFKYHQLSHPDLPTRLRTTGLDRLDPRIFDAAERSLLSFTHIVVAASPVSANFHRILLQLVRQFRVNADLGMSCIDAQWTCVLDLPETELRFIMGAGEPAAVLLQAHWIATTILLDRLRRTDLSCSDWSPLEKLPAWIVEICEPLEGMVGFRDMVAWPLRLARAALKVEGEKEGLLTARELWRVIERRPELFC